MQNIKKLAFIGATMIIFSGCATVDPSLLSYSSTHNVPKLDKDTIHFRAHSWIAETFNDARAVIEMSDLENGRIIGNGKSNFKNPYSVSTPYKFTMIMDFRNGAIRTKYKNYVDAAMSSSIYPEHSVLSIRDDLKQLDIEMLNYITSSEWDAAW